MTSGQNTISGTSHEEGISVKEIGAAPKTASAPSATSTGFAPSTPGGLAPPATQSESEAPATPCGSAGGATSRLAGSCCDTTSSERNSRRARPDYLLWGSLLGVAALSLHIVIHPASTNFTPWYHTLASSTLELMHSIWWGIVIGILFLVALSRVPREMVVHVLGQSPGLNGILRATVAGVLLDLCNHGILMVGAKLYERGARLGQVMAFLIASPWNSFSLTIILIALIGLPWTLGFIALSMVVAVIAGLLFDFFVRRGTLPSNPIQVEVPEGFRLWDEVRAGLAKTRFTPRFIGALLIDGVRQSRMVLRWLLFGVLLASLIRAFVPTEVFAGYFGPTLVGLALTSVAATIIEVCSEGSTPIAADLLNRAKAPGNSFAFLMTGASTDYTEIMVMRDATNSWKIALFLPLLTVPQIFLIAWLINTFA